MLTSTGTNLQTKLELYLDGSSTNSAEFTWPNATTQEESECQVLLAPWNNAFLGQISQAELHFHTLSAEQIFSMAQNCRDWTAQADLGMPKIGWKQFTSVDVFNSAQMMVLPGICFNSNCRPAGDGDCDSEGNGC